MIVWVLAAITAGFFLALIVKRAYPALCALCAAVSASWIGMLALRMLGVGVDPVILALLMGQSVVGGYYLIEPRLGIFKLPAFLTMTLAAYALATPTFAILPALGVLVAVWVGFLAMRITHIPSVRSLSQRIVDCCKNW